MKVCNDCKQEKENDEFYSRKAVCKICSNRQNVQWKKDNRELMKVKRREYKLRDKYGLTVEQFEEMVKAQKGVCYICKTKGQKPTLNVDHCHKTGEVRKLLCDKCNMTLGLVNDSVELLHQFIHYLK